MASVFCRVVRHRIFYVNEENVRGVRTLCHVVTVRTHVTWRHCTYTLCHVVTVRTVCARAVRLPVALAIITCHATTYRNSTIMFAVYVRSVQLNQ